MVLFVSYSRLTRNRQDGGDDGDGAFVDDFDDVDDVTDDDEDDYDSTARKKPTIKVEHIDDVVFQEMMIKFYD